MRLIDADALWDRTFSCEDAADVRKEIEIAPTVDAAPVVHGYWISVKDRLPEADKYVLVITAGGSFKTARCNFYKNGTEVCWATNDGLGEKAITHWMPLPQPPKGE